MANEKSPLQFYRGPEETLPSLAEGEPGWTTDNHHLFIGNSGGTNTKLVSEEDTKEFVSIESGGKMVPPTLLEGPYEILLTDDGEDQPSTAESISYDNSTSSLDATNAQAAIDELAVEKQDKISGNEGQVVGFDSTGNMIAQDAPETGVTSFNGRSGAVNPQQGDYTADMVGARPNDWTPSASDVGAIPISEKGSVNGVATLDNNGKLTESQKPLYTAEEVGAIPEAKVGESNGVAPLGDNGLIPSQYIPGGLDEIQEYENKAGFPPTGEDNIYYFDKETNLMYRWGGTTYVPVNPSLALGETQETAYRGDRGKIAYDHSQLTSGNPHNVTANEVGADPSGTANTKITEHNDSLEAHASLFNAKQDAANAVTITGGGTMIPPEETTGPWKMEFIAEEDGEFPDASSISFNNGDSGLSSTNVQEAIIEVNNKINPESGKKYATIVVGTSLSGHTSDQVDFLCDGTSDQIEINSAINKVISETTNGGEILLLDGTYNIDSTITIVPGTKTLILRGSGVKNTSIVSTIPKQTQEEYEPGTQIQESECKQSCAILIDLDSDYDNPYEAPLIQDLSFSTDVTSCGITFAQWNQMIGGKVKNCSLKGFTNGVFLYNKESIIEQCYFSCPLVGIQLYGGVSYAKIIKCRFEDCGYGLDASGFSNHTLLQGCYFHGCGVGVHFCGSDSQLIDNNFYLKNLETGIELDRPNRDVVSNNSFEGMYDPSDNTAISLIDVIGAVVSANTFYSIFTAIYIKSGTAGGSISNSIVGNTCYNCPSGIVVSNEGNGLENNSGQNTIIGNTVKNASIRGIFIGADENIINGNQITDCNTSQGLVISANNCICIGNLLKSSGNVSETGTGSLTVYNMEI